MSQLLSVAAMTNTSRIYLLTCVSVFCFLKVQKFILSSTLPLYCTKATRRRVVLVSCLFEKLILRMTCNWNLNQRYVLKKMLFSDVISFDPCIFHNSEIISPDISSYNKVEKSLVFFFQVTCEKRSLFQDITWSFLFINPGL